MAFKFEPVCYASFDGNVAGPVTNASFNCTLARTGVGVYTVTLGAPGTPLADFVSHLSVGPLGVGPRSVNIVHTSDLVKTLQIFDVSAFPPPSTDDFRINLAFYFAPIFV